MDTRDGRIYPQSGKSNALSYDPTDHTNKKYNSFLERICDNVRSPHGCGKIIPYIGWFWRDVDFFNRKVPIGDCGEFIGFMENNKWGYHERLLSDIELDCVIAIVDAAMALDAGGDGSSPSPAMDAKLGELWDYMQTLRIEIKPVAADERHGAIST